MSTTEPLKPGTIQFVTDGPPAHKSGRFVELEDHTGASIGVGRWEDRGNGLWALIVEPAEAATLEAVARGQVGRPEDLRAHAGGDPMTIDTRLAEIRAREEAATTGPWMVNGPGEEWAAISSGPHAVIHAYTVHDGDCPGCECGDGAAEVALTIEDAEFIAASRTDLPALLAALTAVLDLHKPGPPYLLDVPEVCEHCSDNEDEREVAYPCPTVQALSAALEVQG